MFIKIKPELRVTQMIRNELKYCRLVKCMARASGVLNSGVSHIDAELRDQTWYMKEQSQQG